MGQGHSRREDRAAISRLRNRGGRKQLVYADTSQRRFMVLTATPTEARADWTFFSTISSRSHTSSTQRSLKILPGSGKRKIVEV